MSLIALQKKITGPNLKVILKYKDHPYIFTIQNQCKAKEFHFTEVNAKDIKKKILKLNKSKDS